MSDCTVQRICLRFCFRLGKTATEAHEMLQKAFKEEALSRTRVFKWFARFKRGEMGIEDRPHSERLSTSRADDNVETIREKINEDRQYTIDEISEATGVSWSSCQRILTADLNMRRVAAKFVLHLLTQDQKKLVWLCARSWKIRLKMTQTFFLRSSRATKVGAMGTTLRPNKLRANGRHPLHRDRKKQDKWGQMWKWCPLFFFDVRGIMHWEFISPGQTVNQEFYLEVLRRLRENVRRKHPELWRLGDWFLRHDNAPAHTALSVTRYLACLGWTFVPHPSYSPDLAPCDIFLFRTMKQTLKGKRFATVEEMKTASQEAHNNIKL